MEISIVTNSLKYFYFFVIKIYALQICKIDSSLCSVPFIKLLKYFSTLFCQHYNIYIHMWFLLIGKNIFKYNKKFEANIKILWKVGWRLKIILFCKKGWVCSEEINHHLNKYCFENIFIHCSDLINELKSALFIKI